MEPEQFSIATTATGHPVYFSREERARHIYVVGKSGSGKSTVLFNLAMLDILAGEGVAIIDPHGDLAEMVADCVPSSRTHEVCYLDVTDTDLPVGFNPLANVPPARQALAASGIVSAFKHLWSDSWGPRLEHWLFQGVASLLATERSTLIDLPRLYTDDEFRERIIRRVTDPITRRFWRDEFASYDQRFRADGAAPILNKVGQFAASPNLRAILGQGRPKFDLGYAMNNGRILIANLARGQIGEQAANLLGSLLVSHLQLVAMERSTLRPEDRLPFYVHVDEFQNFGTDAFASLLSEARKFATHFCLVNQFTDQLQPPVRSALLGNAGSLIVFRVGSADAELLAPEFYPVRPDEISDQSPFWAWLRRGLGHHCIKVSPGLIPPQGRFEIVRAQSRRNFGRPGSAIEGSFR
jgi:hypothetical protein